MVWLVGAGVILSLATFLLLIYHHRAAVGRAPGSAVNRLLAFEGETRGAVAVLRGLYDGHDERLRKAGI